MQNPIVGIGEPRHGQRQIAGAGVGTLTKDERAFMERMAKLDAPAHPGVRPPTDPWPSPA